MKLTIELTPEQIQQLGVSDVAVKYGGKERAQLPIIDSAEAGSKLFDHIKNKQQEHFVVATLDGANRLIRCRIITVGTLTGSLVHPREVFADAITDRAASIVVAHNHPSGSLNPSAADLAVIQRLSECGELLGIKLLDSLIVTADGHASINY